MAADLSAFYRAGSRDRWMLGDSFGFDMRLPSASHVLRVSVLVTRSLTVQIVSHEDDSEIAFGDFHRGVVQWSKLDKARLCATSTSMVQDHVRRALALFARGVFAPAWVHPAVRGELRYAA